MKLEQKKMLNQIHTADLGKVTLKASNSPAFRRTFIKTHSSHGLQEIGTTCLQTWSLQHL